MKTHYQWITSPAAVLCSIRLLPLTAAVFGVHWRLVASPPLRAREVCQILLQSYACALNVTVFITIPRSCPVCGTLSCHRISVDPLSRARTPRPNLSHTHTEPRTRTEPPPDTTLHPALLYGEWTAEQCANNRPARDVSRQRGSCWMKRLFFQPPHISTWAEWAVKLLISQC